MVIQQRDQQLYVTSKPRREWTSITRNTHLWPLNGMAENRTRATEMASEHQTDHATDRLQVNVESPHRTQEGALLQVPCKLSQRKNTGISTLRFGNEMREIWHHQVIANSSYCLRQGLDLTNPLICRKRDQKQCLLCKNPQKDDSKGSIQLRRTADSCRKLLVLFIKTEKSLWLFI